MNAGRRAQLLTRLRAREALAKRKAQRPLDFVRWLKPQGQVLRHTSKRLLYRGGNQLVGKSTVGAAELIWRCLGRHPHKRVRSGPIEAVVATTTVKQGLALQKKVRALLPDAEIDWTVTTFSAKTAFGANGPTIVFKNGSVVRFVTTEQGAGNIQGSTLHFVWIDELCTPEVYRELDRRVLATSGDILMTLTPINRPAEWLAEMVDAGLIDEVHVRLTVDALTHEDGKPRTLEDGTVLDQAWIDEQRRVVPAQWAGIILDGEWRIIGLGAFFAKVFDRAVHVSDDARFDLDQGPIRWHLGIDYAAADRPAGSVATLIAVQQTKADAPMPARDWVIVEDAVVLPGVASVAQLADEVVAMLARAGLRWRDLHSAYGDNPVTGRFEYKSNLDFTKRLAHRLQIAQNAIHPRLLNAKEGRASGGSLDAGVRYLYELLVGRRLLVRSKALPIVEALEGYVHGDKLHPTKDRVDSLRYSLKDYVFSTSNPHSGIVLRLGR